MMPAYISFNGLRIIVSDYYLDAFKLLVDNGLDLYATDSNNDFTLGETIFKDVCSHRYCDITNTIQYLVSLGIYHGSGFVQLCNRNNYSLIQYLLTNANVTLDDLDDGLSGLFYNIFDDITEKLVTLLLNAGANPANMSKYFSFYYVNKHKYKSLKLLLEHGLDEDTLIKLAR